MTSSKSEANDKIKRLEGFLQETQTRLEDSERIKDEQSEKIKKLEQDLKDARHKRKGFGLMKAFTTKKEPLTNDLKTVTSSRSEADGEIRRLEGSLQQTQTRLEDAERVKDEQSQKIKKLEQDLKDARSKQKGLRTKKEPLQGAVETVQPESVIESKQTIVCESFSDDNVNVTVSSCKRRAKYNWSTGDIGGTQTLFRDLPKCWNIGKFSRSSCSASKIVPSHEI